MAKTAKAKPIRKTGKELVDEYIARLEHPFKKELEAVRKIILKANPKMQERIKWNSPSFFYHSDFGAFHLRDTSRLHLVLVFPNGIVADGGGLLEGDYKDRRMVYFTSMKDVKAKQATLEKVVNAWIALDEKN